MKGSDGFVQGYNCQVVVDADHQVIVAEAVTNQPPDPEHWQPMLERTIQNCGKIPEAGLADTGYFSDENIVHGRNQGIDLFIATGRQKHGEAPPTVRGRPPRQMTQKPEMRRKLATKAGRAMYSRRKTIVEPVFGQIKEARGFRRFLLRGIAKVRGEWSLISLTHNLLKLHRFQVA